MQHVEGGATRAARVAVQDITPVSAVDDSAATAVDPSLKARITNLVSALGGPDATEIGNPYKLGDDALACLRDLKTWIRGYDEKLQRWDVARAISETSLVTFDLVEILTMYSLRASTGNCPASLERTALACLEILVPLTWPIHLDKDLSSPNQLYHAPYLKQARLKYKRAILVHPGNRIFNAVINLCIPSISKELKDRTTREEGILRLAVYFIRNILAIEPPDEDITDDVSRSNTINVMGQQMVLQFIVTIASQMGQRFMEQDTAILESLYHLLYGVEVEDVYSGSGFSTNSKRHDLQGLLDLEKDLKRDARRNAPTRHNRFGSMISVVMKDNARLSVSSQSALKNIDTSLDKLDSAKKWHRPSSRRTNENQDWVKYIPLSMDSRSQVIQLTDSFLNSAFNPLFTHIRKGIEHDIDALSERMLDIHRTHFLYLMGWFLEAERLRRHSLEQEDFGLVASALTQNTFIIVMKLMRDSYEVKDWNLVYTSMVCFKQILLVVGNMENSRLKEDREMAQNMKSRLFYEEYSLDVLATLPRTAESRGIAYLGECISLSHVVLKMLEEFSKQHSLMYIRTKRKKARKSGASAEENGPIQDKMASEDEDEQTESNRITSERKFEFSRFESKYINEHTIQSYIVFLHNYRELSDTEILWVITFFHRIFTKRESHVILYRLDLMELFSDMVSKEVGLKPTQKSRAQVDKFVAHYMSKLRKNLETTPSLYVEVSNGQFLRVSELT